MISGVTNGGHGGIPPVRKNGRLYVLYGMRV